MKRGSAKTAVVFIVATIAWSYVFLACSGRNRRAASRNASNRPQSAASPSAGDCYNPFFPASPDTTLEYEATFSNNNPRDYTYSVTFSDLSDGSFIEHQTVTGGVAPASYDSPLDISWRCQPDGLVSTEYADLSRAEPTLKLETADVSGVTIPAPERWHKGTKWTYGYTVRGQMSFMGAPKPVDVDGVISVTAEIVGREKLVVPAGNYETERVQSAYSQALTMKGNPSMPLNISFTVHSWYARDIGLIKCTSEDLRITTVLQSVTK